MDNIMETLKKGFSVFASGTKKLTKTVAGKTSNFVDITKLNIALNDTEKKINAIYEQIGKIVYQKYSEGLTVTSDFTDMCAEIDEFLAEQESLKEQIAELKSSTVCPECGSSNDKENEFCSKCGSSLSKEIVNEPDDQVIEIVDCDNEE